MELSGRSLRTYVFFLGSALWLAGCAGQAPAPPPPKQAVQLPTGKGVYKIGNPYEIDNVWYYPHEQPDYDETGIASWYGPTFYGKVTANGELYDGNKLTAAHRTLPMPVLVRVTDLENGRSVVVRVNDRGPYARGRIIDLSRRAAELLGMIKKGTARVRVTYIGRAPLENGAPPPSETPAAVANALPAVPTGKVQGSNLAAVPGARVETQTTSGTALSAPAPSSLPPETSVAANQPGDQVTEVPVPTHTRLYVQVGAFAQFDNARRLRDRIGQGLRISPLHRDGRTLYRVRTGPLNSVSEADAALARITGAGSEDARIVVDQ